MGETFYTALEVEADADTETIKQAYRNQVKETHPDVSDEPGAAEEFKRLTTARDVLVDGAERRRYDQLGHSAYVREHVSDSAWADDSTTETRSPRAATGETSATSQSTQTTTGTWYTNVSDSTTSRSTESAGHSNARSGQASRADGGYGNADWQTASDAYRRTDMNVTAETNSSVETVVGVANALGPWLFVHLSLLLSAVATGSFFIATSLHADISLAALVGAGLLIVLVTALSMLHILLQLYS